MLGLFNRELLELELERGSGSQFDPDVVDALLAVLDRDSERADALGSAWTEKLSGPLRAA